MREHMLPIAVPSYFLNCWHDMLVHVCLKTFHTIFQPQDLNDMRLKVSFAFDHFLAVLAAQAPSPTILDCSVWQVLECNLWQSQLLHKINLLYRV